MCAGMWGLTEEGTFLSSVDAKLSFWLKLKAAVGLGTENIYNTVMLDLKKVRTALSLEMQRFEFSVLSEKERGRRLLYLFQKDLLPGVNAMILESKGKRDFVAEASKVERYQKAFAWVFILTLDVALLFYIFLFAVQQSSARQEAWFNTFIVWLLLEVVLMSTIVVYCNHFLLPSLIMGDLRKVKRRLLKTIGEFKNSVSEGDSGASARAFNVADYFFVSSRLSEQYPDLLESKIIKKFSSPWPHQSYQRTKDVSKSYSKRFSTLGRSASMIAVFFLKAFLTVPPSVQDMLTNLITVVVTGNVFSALVTMYRLSPFLPFIVVGVLALILHFLTKLLCRTVKARRLASIAAKVSAGQPKNKRRNQVSIVRATASAAGSATDSCGVHEASTQQPPSFKHKTRRESVQEGLHVVRDLQMHHSKQPVLRVRFDDVSSDSGTDSESNEKPNARSRFPAGAALFDIEISDDEDCYDTVRAAVDIDGKADVAFSGLFSEEEIAKARIPAVWGEISDDSDADEKGPDFVAEVKGETGQGSDEPVSTAIESSDVAIDIGSNPVSLPHFSAKELAKARAPAVWGEVSDDSDLDEEGDDFPEAAADVDVFKLLVADKK